MKAKVGVSQKTQTIWNLTRLQYAEIEHELKKSPDFQLYMLTAAANDRERMERLLAKVPAFRIWRRLSKRIDGLRGVHRHEIAHKNFPPRNVLCSCGQHPHNRASLCSNE